MDENADAARETGSGSDSTTDVASEALTRRPQNTNTTENAVAEATAPVEPSSSHGETRNARRSTIVSFFRPWTVARVIDEMPVTVIRLIVSFTATTLSTLVLWSCRFVAVMEDEGDDDRYHGGLYSTRVSLLHLQDGNRAQVHQTFSIEGAGLFSFEEVDQQEYILHDSSDVLVTKSCKPRSDDFFSTYAQVAAVAGIFATAMGLTSLAFVVTTPRFAHDVFPWMIRSMRFEIIQREEEREGVDERYRRASTSRYLFATDSPPAADYRNDSNSNDSPDSPESNQGEGEPNATSEATTASPDSGQSGSGQASNDNNAETEIFETEEQPAPPRLRRPRPSRFVRRRLLLLRVMGPLLAILATLLQSLTFLIFLDTDICRSDEGVSCRLARGGYMALGAVVLHTLTALGCLAGYLVLRNRAYRKAAEGALARKRRQSYIHDGLKSRSYREDTQLRQSQKKLTSDNQKGKDETEGDPEEGAKDDQFFEDEDDSHLVCIICQRDYEDDDDVCYSTNSDCPHIFHRECMLAWLMKKTDDGDVRGRDEATHHLCPICRRPYVAKEGDHIVANPGAS